MSTQELITALKELPTDEQIAVFQSVFGPLTDDNIAAIRLRSEYLPGGALYIAPDETDFLDPSEYLPSVLQH